MDILYKPVKYNFTKDNMKPKYIVLHDTGNTSAGADAIRHYQYFNGGNRNASAHYFIDDKQVVQIIPDHYQAWHCGRKYTDNVKVADCGNHNSIGVEVCINSDGDIHKAIELCIELIKSLMEEFNIPADRVITHMDTTGKKCPSTLIKLDKVSYIMDKIKKPLESELEPSTSTWGIKALEDAELNVDYWKDKTLGEVNAGEFVALMKKVIKCN